MESKIHTKSGGEEIGELRDLLIRMGSMGTIKECY